MYDVVIVGSGPAGLFAAHELSKRKSDVLVIEEGKDIEDRDDIMRGLGGAGTFSDGTLNLRPDVGGNLFELTSEKSAHEVVEHVDSVFSKFGAPQKKYGMNEAKVEELQRRSASAGIKFVSIPQKHIGTDNAPKVVSRFVDYLKGKGIKFLLETKVDDILIEEGSCTGVITKDKTIKSKRVLLAPGRVGASWMDSLVQKHSINARFGPVDVGVRVEIPSIVLDPVIEVSHDPKFHIETKTYDDFVRTFCTNHRGFVVTERYDGYIGVNGHTLIRKKTQNSNFAFLVRIQLTEPVENTIEYGRSIAELATTIGGGKPLVQRVGDLRRGRRSHKQGIEKNPVIGTLRDATPGDISMALPHRVVVDILEGLEKLDKVIPGVTSDSTLLYAPEIKYYSIQLHVNEGMETSVNNLFVAGDGAGLSRGIVVAAATGVLAARGMHDS